MAGSKLLVMSALRAQASVSICNVISGTPVRNHKSIDSIQTKGEGGSVGLGTIYSQVLF